MCDNFTFKHFTFSQKLPWAHPSTTHGFARRELCFRSLSSLPRIRDTRRQPCLGQKNSPDHQIGRYCVARADAALK